MIRHWQKLENKLHTFDEPLNDLHVVPFSQLFSRVTLEDTFIAVFSLEMSLSIH